MGHRVVDEHGAGDRFDSIVHTRHVQTLDAERDQLRVTEALDRGERELPNDAERTVGRRCEL